MLRSTSKDTKEGESGILVKLKHRGSEGYSLSAGGTSHGAFKVNKSVQPESNSVIKDQLLRLFSVPPFKKGNSIEFNV